MSAPKLIVVMGPTASGKSTFSETVASKLGCEIINADAFQIYRGMDIGTAKPLIKDNYQLLDIRNPDQDFGVGEYVQLASKLLHDYYSKGQSVVLTGGTGLYVRALLEEYKDLMPSPSFELRQSLSTMPLSEAVEKLSSLDKEIVKHLDLKNEVRVKRALEKRLSGQKPIAFSIPPFQTTKLAIIPNTEDSNAKIKQRTIKMFQNGWVAEVKELLDQGYRPGCPGFRALGYEAIANYVQEHGNEQELLQRIECDTVKYAKRQRTWLRAEPNLVVYNEVSEALEATVPRLTK